MDDLSRAKMGGFYTFIAWGYGCTLTRRGDSAFIYIGFLGDFLKGNVDKIWNKSTDGVIVEVINQIHDKSQSPLQTAAKSGHDA